ncbi:MAG: hypothetical protein ACSHX0_11345 [Akkermansiaceae bacterium]
MSLHAQLSPEVLKRLKAQQRNNTITSVIISVLIIVLVGLLLFWVLLPPINNYEAEIVSYSVPTEETQNSDKPKQVRSLESKPVPPAAASESMAKVIASSVTSSVSIAVPDEISLEDSLDFAEEISFDDAWGDVGDALAGTTSFFGTEVSAERIVYVIDYSKSMAAKNREPLMRKELADSVKKLSSSMQYQMVFFAGNAWVAGADLIIENNSKKQPLPKGYIDDKGKEVRYGKKNIWEPKWITADKENISKSVKVIKDTRLLLGTKWDLPLDVAFEMKPLPDTIIFMTDGLTGGDVNKVAKDYANQAKKKGIVIHTISLVEPQAAEAMSILAENTGGTFSLIDEKGKKVSLKNDAKK